MGDDYLVELIKEGLKLRAAMSPEEWHRDLVNRGIINEKGDVLLRMPIPPWESYDDEEPDGESPPAGQNGSPPQ